MIAVIYARNSSIGLLPLLHLAIGVLMLAGCTTTTPARSGRVVMSQHSGWNIRVAPSFTDRWRAGVRVWPPEIDPKTHGGINVHFTESASSESAIVSAAIAAGRRYVDDNRRKD